MKRWFKKLLWLSAKRFIAGKGMRRALKIARMANKRGIEAAIDILGENSAEKEEIAVVRKRYEKLIDWISKNKRKVSVSLKLSQFGLSSGLPYCFKEVEPLVRKAAAAGVFVWIDMEGDKYFKDILRAALILRLENKNVGVAYQAYRRDALEYLPPLIESRIAIRLCKGAYRESNEVVFKKTEEIRGNFLALAEKILGKNYLAIATHDDYLLNQIQIFAKKNKIHRDRFEFQMLLGLDRQLSWLANLGYRCVVYIPFGKNWLPYILRRIWEKPLKTLLMAWKGWRQSGRKKEKSFLAELFNHDHHHHCDHNHDN